MNDFIKEAERLSRVLEDIAQTALRGVDNEQIRGHLMDASALLAHIQREAVPDGWKEATIAWEVCASIHREYAKKKDPFFSTRQADFVRHTETARAAMLAAGMVGEPAKVPMPQVRWATCPETDTPCSHCPTKRIPCQAMTAPAEVLSADQLWNNDEVMALNAELGLTIYQLLQLANAITRITHKIPPADWRERFSQAVYDDLAAADNQDVPLEEYPALILKVLDAVIGHEMNPATSEVTMPESIERLAITRYRTRPKGMFGCEVVAGDGSRSLFEGSRTECCSIARKLAEAFLDGAHVAIAAGDAREAVGYARGREEAGRDADRYSFLRGDGGPTSVRWPSWEVAHWTGNWNPVSGKELDAAIDAALRGEVKP